MLRHVDVIVDVSAHAEVGHFARVNCAVFLQQNVARRQVTVHTLLRGQKVLRTELT